MEQSQSELLSAAFSGASFPDKELCFENSNFDERCKDDEKSDSDKGRTLHQEGTGESAVLFSIDVEDGNTRESSDDEEQFQGMYHPLEEKATSSEEEEKEVEGVRAGELLMPLHCRDDSGDEEDGTFAEGLPVNPLIRNQDQGEISEEEVSYSQQVPETALRSDGAEGHEREREAESVWESESMGVGARNGPATAALEFPEISAQNLQDLIADVDFSGEENEGAGESFADNPSDISSREYVKDGVKDQESDALKPPEEKVSVMDVALMDPSQQGDRNLCSPCVETDADEFRSFREVSGGESDSYSSSSDDEVLAEKRRRIDEEHLDPKCLQELEKHDRAEDSGLSDASDAVVKELCFENSNFDERCKDGEKSDSDEGRTLHQEGTGESAVLFSIDVEDGNTRESSGDEEQFQGMYHPLEENSTSSEEEEKEVEGVTAGELLMSVHCRDDSGDEEDGTFAEGLPVNPQEADKPLIRNQDQGEISEEEVSYSQQVPETALRSDGAEGHEREEAESVWESESTGVGARNGPATAALEFPEISAQNLQDLIADVNFSGEENEGAGESFADYPSDFSSCEYVKDGVKDQESDALKPPEEKVSVMDVALMDPSQQGDRNLCSPCVETDADEFRSFREVSGGESDSYSSSSDEDLAEQRRRIDEEHLDPKCLQELEKHDRPEDSGLGDASDAVVKELCFENSNFDERCKDDEKSDSDEGRTLHQEGTGESAVLFSIDVEDGNTRESSGDEEQFQGMYHPLEENSTSSEEEEKEVEGVTAGELLMSVHCRDDSGDEEDGTFAEGLPVNPQEADKPLIRNQDQGEISEEEVSYSQQVPETALRSDGAEGHEREREEAESVWDSESTGVGARNGPATAALEFPEISAQNLQDLIADVDFSAEENEGAGESFADYPSDFSSRENVKDGVKDQESDALKPPEEKVSVMDVALMDTSQQGDRNLCSPRVETDADEFRSFREVYGGESDSYSSSSDDEVLAEKRRRIDEEHLDPKCLQQLEKHNRAEDSGLGGASNAVVYQWSVNLSYNAEDTGTAAPAHVGQRPAEEVVESEDIYKGSLDDNLFFDTGVGGSGVTEPRALGDDEEEEEEEEKEGERSWEQEQERIKAFFRFYNDSDREEEREERRVKVQFCAEPLSQVIHYDTDSSDRGSLSSFPQTEEDFSSADEEVTGPSDTIKKSPVRDAPEKDGSVLAMIQRMGLVAVMVAVTAMALAMYLTQSTDIP